MALRAHVEWLKEGVTKWNKRRSKVKFCPDLRGVNFYELLPSDYRDSPKTSRTFERIDLSHSDLTGADLSDLNFRRADFRESKMKKCNLSLSNFTEAKFQYTDLRKSDARNSSFAGAKFEKTEMTGLALEGADFSEAIVISSGSDKVEEKIIQSMGAKICASASDYAIKAEASRKLYNIGAAEYSVDKATVDTRTAKNRYDVFFGTNRDPIFERGGLVDFNANRSNQLSYGLCEVIVPDGRRVGTLGSPIWRRLLNRKDDRLRLEALIALNEELFFNHLRATSERMKLKERPTIFVHGFNNSFESAVLRAAQIGYDLGLGQGIGLFSWPSKGKKRAYSADEASAEASKYLLADFIEKFVTMSPAGSLNIISHSMGCRCLLGSLEVLSNGRKSVLRNINQVILAAADIDSGLMSQLGLAVTKYAKRTTSYASDRDDALRISGWLHSFPRVGFVPPTFVMNGMDTVVVNDDDLGILSHGYVGSSREVLNDIFALLARNEDPSSRFSVEPFGNGYWRIKN